MKAKGEIKEKPSLVKVGGKIISKSNDMRAYTKSLGTKVLKKDAYKSLHRNMYK